LLQDPSQVDAVLKDFRTAPITEAKRALLAYILRRHHGLRALQFLQSLDRRSRCEGHVEARSRRVREPTGNAGVYISEMIRVHLRLWAAVAALCTISAMAQPPRARDLGVPLEGTPGPLNAVTDIAGIEVGRTTLIEGAGVRTGVTAIWPRGKHSDDPAFVGWFSLNGNGEMTGTTWLEESGFWVGPVLITNTHSVGVVRDAFIPSQAEHKRQSPRTVSTAVSGRYRLWPKPGMAF
jgi:hypothetical protein